MVTFKIAGKAYTDENLLVLIPSMYKHLFEGHEFRDMHDFSLALMFAGCAAEACYYKKPWIQEDDERSLMRVLTK